MDSELKRLQIREHLLEQLMAQISAYTGIKNSGLANLQDLHHRLLEGKSFICEDCGGDIQKRGHMVWCSIIAEYEQLFEV